MKICDRCKKEVAYVFLVGFESRWDICQDCLPSWHNASADIAELVLEYEVYLYQSLEKKFFSEKVMP